VKCALDDKGGREGWRFGTTLRYIAPRARPSPHHDQSRPPSQSRSLLPPQAPTPGDACPQLHVTTRGAIGQTIWFNPLMTGDHSLHWMYGGGRSVNRQCGAPCAAAALRALKLHPPPRLDLMQSAL
jgi:hypothetical protein